MSVPELNLINYESLTNFSHYVSVIKPNLLLFKRCKSNLVVKSMLVLLECILTSLDPQTNG